MIENSLWLLSLPLKHREINQQTPEVINQDRQIIFTYLKEKLVNTGDVCQLSLIELPEFKVSHQFVQHFSFTHMSDWYFGFTCHC